ncbi:Myb-related protein 2 [Glycine soja]
MHLAYPKHFSSVPDVHTVIQQIQRVLWVWFIYKSGLAQMTFLIRIGLSRDILCMLIDTGKKEQKTLSPKTSIKFSLTNHQQQAKSMHALRMHSPTERHMMMHGGNGSGDSGLVLSTDAKPRLKWTPDLHERFIEAVNELGGVDKATPKIVLKLMGIPRLTLYHLKSHLQTSGREQLDT